MANQVATGLLSLGGFLVACWTLGSIFGLWAGVTFLVVAAYARFCA